MRRNLHGRVEVTTPVKDRLLKRKLMEILQISLDDQNNAWELLPDGIYQKVKGKGASASLGSQDQLMRLTLARCQFSAPDEN